jgi:sugar phosphate isomerase/epimerase
MKLGMVTYQLGAGWDLDTLIEKCGRLGFEGVELRTTHKHGVEPAISSAKRLEVKVKFENSPVELVGLGSCCEYHSSDPAELKKNMEMTREFILLAHDVGAGGVKVRPNALPPGIQRGKTVEQIGVSLGKAAEFASGYGVKIRLEVHGSETSRPACIKEIVDIAGSRNLYVCWNSGKNDLDESGSIGENFQMLKDRIELCHINELCSDYPWISLFSLLQQEGYQGFCLAEVPASSEPERFMQYYKALFNALQQIASKRGGGGR